MKAQANRSAQPRSVVWATTIDVLARDRVLRRRDDYLVVRTPGNPAHFWGNFLLLDDPPLAGTAELWEGVFAVEIGSDPEVEHQALGWDHIDGGRGSGAEEFIDRGFALEETVGLVGTPVTVRAHPRENRDVTVRALASTPGADEALWEQVIALQVASEDRFDTQSYRDYCRARLADLRDLFRHGRGAWYVALDAAGSESEVLASCGVVVTGGRGRFQVVDTAAAHRRRGICSRLVVEAAHHAVEQYGAQQLVICADPEYHALGLYESLGFHRAEHVCGLWRHPSTSASSTQTSPTATASAEAEAARHP